MLQAMKVENAVYPEQETMIALLSEGHEGKVRMIPHVTKAGGKLIDGGEIVGVIIGEAEPCWDTFALVEYPSVAISGL